MASTPKQPRLDTSADDPPEKNDTLDGQCYHTSDSPDWFRVFNGPALPVILNQLDRKSTCNLRLTCRMLGGTDLLKDKCFGFLRLRMWRHPEDDDLCCYRLNDSTYIRLDDQVSFDALGRLAPFVNEMIVLYTYPSRFTGDQELALMQPLPRFPNVWMLEWLWRCQQYGHYPNPETLLALARLTPAVVQVSLAAKWALIPGAFHAQLLSLWPQLKDVRVRGNLDGRLCGLQRDPHTLLNAAASRGLLTELDLNLGRLEFDLSALISNNRTSLRVLGLQSAKVSNDDLTALFRLNTLEKLILVCIDDQSGEGIVSRDFLMALASVTTLKVLTLGGIYGRDICSCTAMDLVHLFRDAQFSLRMLKLNRCPFTAALPRAVAHTQKELENIWLKSPVFAEGEPKTVDKRVLEELPKMKRVECVLNSDSF